MSIKTIAAVSLCVLHFGCVGEDPGGMNGGDGGAGDAGRRVFDPNDDPAGAISATGRGAITLAGDAESGDADGPRAAARFWNPVNVALGPDGNLYVADTDNGLIRVVRPSGATVTFTSQPDFSHPFGMAFGPDGTLYVQTDANETGRRNNDTGSLWRVDRRTGEATLLAHDLGRPRGLAALSDGTLVLVDNEHHVVRRFNPMTMQMTDLAGARDMAGFADGQGAAARFDHPYDVVVAGDRLIVADQNNNRLRAITFGGAVTTFAGSGMPASADGQRMTASFNRPQGLAIDRAGNVYVTEIGGFVLRRVSTGGMVTTVAGAGRAGFADGEPMQAQFFGLEGVDVTPDGNTLYVADGNRGTTDPYHRIRRVALVGDK